MVACTPFISKRLTRGLEFTKSFYRWIATAGGQFYRKMQGDCRVSECVLSSSQTSGSGLRRTATSDKILSRGKVQNTSLRTESATPGGRPKKQMVPRVACSARKSKKYVEYGSKEFTPGTANRAKATARTGRRPPHATHDGTCEHCRGQTLRKTENPGCLQGFGLLL